jgi:cellulose synthase/poly-beta-1,6-N-acetylglucosamine synthase-like glycosyltransferase
MTTAEHRRLRSTFYGDSFCSTESYCTEKCKTSLLNCGGQAWHVTEDAADRQDWKHFLRSSLRLTAAGIRHVSYTVYLFSSRSHPDGYMTHRHCCALRQNSLLCARHHQASAFGCFDVFFLIHWWFFFFPSSVIFPSFLPYCLSHLSSAFAICEKWLF